MKPLLPLAALAMFVGATALTPPAQAQDDKTSLTMNMVQIIGTIDPAKVNDYTEYMAIVNLYDALTTVSPEGKVVPQLAESWDISDDSKTYTFHLKKDATFQDGTPVEAKDVIYSMKRLLALNEGPSYLFAGLVDPEGVTAPDAHTVVIKLNRVYAPFISNTPLILVVNEDLVKENSKKEWGDDYLADHSAGAGPYTLGSWRRGAQMVLERYADYHMGWPNEKPIDEVRLVVTRDEATVKALATKGELGMSSQYQSNETYDAIAKMDNYKVIKTNTATNFYIKLNTKLAPTDDIHIRRALAYATDYKTIREELNPGAPLAGPLAPVFADAYDDSLKLPEYNLEKAKEEVAKSKYAGQEPIELTFSYVAKTAFEEEIGLLYKATLEQIGFSVKLDPEPWNRITELASKPETTPNATEVFYGPTYPSPDSVFYVQYHSKAAGTWSSMEWLQDKEVDALIDKSRETTDTEARNEIYKQIQQRIVSLQPDVFLMTQEQRFAANKCLQGYAWVPMQSWQFDFSRYWWDCKE